MTDVETGKMFIFDENTPWNEKDDNIAKYEIEIPLTKDLPTVKNYKP